MKAGCLFGPLLWLFGRDVQKSPPTSKNDASVGEGNIHSGPGGYEDASYEGGYAADYLGGENDEH